MSKIKALILFSFLVLFLLIPKLSAFCESITFTTYYPAPFGVYSQLRAKKMAIGDTYYDSSQHCWSGGPCIPPYIDADADLVVEGKVGIGTADLETWNSAFSALQIGSETSLFGRTASQVSNSLNLGQNTYLNAAGNWTYQIADEASVYVQQSGKHTFKVAPVGTADTTITFTDGMTIDSNGNVGIGTTAPIYKLNVISGSAWNTTHSYASFGSNGDARHLVLGNYYTGSDAYSYIQARYDVGDVTVHPLLLNPYGGNVGIGTTAPGSKLDVAGSGPEIRLTYLNSSSDDRNWAIGNATAPIYHGELGFYNGTSAGAAPTQLRMTILRDGKVGIGTANPGYLLHLAGGAYCNGTGDWITGSDRAYKKDIDYDFKYGLKEVEQLKPVYYVHKEDKDNSKQIGFIAQDVRKVIPELVSGDEGALGLSYGQLTAVLVKAMQEQGQMIEFQQKAILALKQQMASLIVEVDGLKEPDRQ